MSDFDDLAGPDVLGQDQASSNFVTNAPVQFATGDGITPQFWLAPDSQDIISCNVFALWRKDWQGNLQLSTTPRTNLLLQSQAFLQAPWATLGSVNLTGAAAVAPDGSLTAKLVAQSANGSSLYQDVPFSGGQQAAASVFIAPATATALQLTLWWFTGGVAQEVSATFNPSTGVLVPNGGSPGTTLAHYAVIPLAGGWYRIAVGGVGNDTSNTKARFQIYDNSGTVSSYYVWGAQLEAGILQTSYIPTELTQDTITDYSVDTLLGLITFGQIPVLGAALTWMGNYIYVTAEEPAWDPPLMSQYANSPVITGLMQSFAEAIDPEADIENFYNLMWNVDTAQGYGLDVWGRIVGVNRVLAVPNTSEKYLGYMEANSLSGEPFNWGLFWNGAQATQNFALSDDLFRTVILVKALMNISRATIATYNKALMTLFPGIGNCYVVETGPMKVQLTFPAPLSVIQKAILQQTGIFAPPTGVQFTIAP